MESFIIGIAGGTGSGKTTLTKRLKERFGDDVVHIVILVLSQTSAKDHIAFLGSKFCIFLIQSIVLLVVDRIVWLNARLPLRRIFS